MKGSSRKNCKTPCSSGPPSARSYLNEGQFPKELQAPSLAPIMPPLCRDLNEGQFPKELQAFETRGIIHHVWQPQ